MALIQEEAINKGLITKSLKKKKHFFILMITIVFILLNLIVLFLTKNFLNNFYLTLFILPIYIATIHFYLININQQRYERTKIGKEINLKLEGLKNFLKDFSILNERNKEEIALWEEYIVYSVLFDQNVNIIKELSKHLNIK